MSAPLPGPEPGLCGRCRHVRRTGNRRGSVFFLCALSREDARFPRYPRLPVLRCAGFAPAGAPSAPPPEGGAPPR